MAHFSISGIKEGDELLDVRENTVLRFKVTSQRWEQGKYTIETEPLPFGCLDVTGQLFFRDATDPTALRESAQRMMAVADDLERKAANA